MITRCASNSCLGHVIVNDVKMSYSIDILPYDLFDHKIIITEIKNEKWEEENIIENKNVKEIYTYLNMKKFTDIVNNEKNFLQHKQINQ